MSDIPSDKDLGELRRQFDTFDVDGNGEISYEEFVSLLEAIGPRPTEEEAQLAFTVIDVENDGAVRFAEFVKWWSDS